MSYRFKFRAMTYNLHLFGNSLGAIDNYVDVASTLGIADPLTFYDDQRLSEFIYIIRNKLHRPPDVIGLTEVWDKSLAERLEDELSDLYPHIAAGSYVSSRDGAITFSLPDFDVLGAGLLLMSRYPFDGDPVFHPYISEAGFDAWAEKGVLAAKIQVPDIAATVGVLLTHLQADSDEADIRRDQLAELASVAAGLRLSSPRMALITMGDFNVIGEDSNGQQTNEYRRMIEQLGLSDTWRVQHPDDPGVTYAGEINDLSKIFDEDNTSQKRLDYIFYDPSPSYYVDCEPTLCELLKYRSTEEIGGENVRDISDHYGLLAEYGIEVRPFGTITYHVDVHPDMPNIETPALRSLLAWMEKAAIGYARVDPTEEAPIIRVGFAADNDFQAGQPVIERLGRAHMNPRPLLNDHGDPWLWGLGYDPQARQLDLAYALQHFIGLALHSVSPRANLVKAPLDEQNAVSKSVMLPYQSERELVDGYGQPDPDHLNHLTNSDIEYITALYGRRTELFDWRDKVQALQNNDLIRTILESGLTGTNGLIAQNIVHIDRQIAEVQAEIPIDAEVYIHELFWTGGINDWGFWEDEEIRFILTAEQGEDPHTKEKRNVGYYPYPSSDGEYEIKSENPVLVPVRFNPFRINHILPDLTLTLKVTELDSWFNGCNKDHIQARKLADLTYRKPNELNRALDELRSLSAPSSYPLELKQIDHAGKWRAKLEVVLWPGSKKEVVSLNTERTKQQKTLNRLRRSFGRDLVAALSSQLDQTLGGPS